LNDPSVFLPHTCETFAVELIFIAQVSNRDIALKLITIGGDEMDDEETFV